MRKRLTAVVNDPELLSAETEKTEEVEDIVGRSRALSAASPITLSEVQLLNSSTSTEKTTCGWKIRSREKRERIERDYHQNRILCRRKNLRFVLGHLGYPAA
ncbi:hypothetical protein Bca101_083001 [Brassica carinata]